MSGEFKVGSGLACVSVAVGLGQWLIPADTLGDEFRFVLIIVACILGFVGFGLIVHAFLPPITNPQKRLVAVIRIWGVVGIVGILCYHQFSRTILPIASIAPSTKQPDVPTAMPSLLSLFMTDYKGKGSGGGISLSSDGRDDLTLKNDTKLRIFFQINEDYGNRSKFMSFYIQSSPQTYEAIEFLAATYRKYLNATLNVEEGGVASSSVTKTSELVFTGRVFIYHEDTLSLSELGKLSDLYQSRGLSPQFLTTPYAISVWESIRSGSSKPPARYELRDGIPRKVGGANVDK